jgi:predicted nuclease of restriction endonuclease-like (RecB) superfamily
MDAYLKFLEEIKTYLKQAQLKATLSVNHQMILTYWGMGKKILLRQAEQGWGAKVIDTLAQDLKSDFPKMKGISARNLKYMRKFAETYPDFEIVQAPLAQISWYHHIALMDKLKDSQTRLWYAQKAIENGWSRNVMVAQIKAEAHQKFGKLPNNFKTTLPIEQSELVTNLLKDEYLFDFIAQDEKILERELEEELTQNITKFLLELGKGFAFIGRQYHLEVGGDDFYLDMLFYHFRLKCFVVIELKIDDFKPEYAGKLNFYLSSVDALLQQKDDNPSIGLLLCDSKNDIVVEFALKDIHKPMGVASYQLTKQIPENLKKDLPTEEDLKKIIRKTDLKRKK